MNISSALISSIIKEQDLETWGNLHERYLPEDYHSIFIAIKSHVDKNNKLPSFEDIKLSVPSPKIKEQAAILEVLDIDSEPALLLEYLKNEYTQNEVLGKLDRYLDNSVMMASAEESLDSLDAISQDIRKKVDLEVSSISMQDISILETQEEVDSHMELGLNTLYDNDQKFSNTDLVLIGGRRGIGKSFTCANLAISQFEDSKDSPGVSSLYFTIEMTKEQTFRRMASISSGVMLSKITNREDDLLSQEDFRALAKFQHKRFKDSEDIYEDFISRKSLRAKDYDEFEKTLRENRELYPNKQLDIVYDPQLSLEKIRSTINQKLEEQDIKLVIVDYLNQVRMAGQVERKTSQFDWLEQIEVSKVLKQIAQDFKVLLITPYQTDATGEARFSKGVLDAADAAFTIETWTPEEECITFECQKMRNGPMRPFTSVINWNSLKIGPAEAPTPTWENIKKSSDELFDSTGNTSGGERYNLNNRSQE